MSLGNCEKSGTKRLRDTLKYNIRCNDGKVVSAKRYDTSNRWAASGSERRITAKDFMEYYAVKYVTATDVISYKVSRKESFIDVVAREGTELKVVLHGLEISRFKRVASKDDKVRRSQAKRRMAGKTLGIMEEKLLTPELNTPLKLARLNEMSDRPVDMATVSSTVVRNLAKRKAIKWGIASRSVTSASVDDSSKRRKITSPTKSQVVLEESDKIAEVADLRPRFELELEKEREVAALKLKEVRTESVAEAERLVTASATSRNNLAGKLYQLRYTKAEIMAFSEGNYEDKKIMDEEEVEEMEDGLNKIESSRHRVVDFEGLLEVEKNPLLNCRPRRHWLPRAYRCLYCKFSVCFCRPVSQLEYEALISQYEDWLDENVKLSLKLDEAKSQVKDMTATILSRDLALNQLTSELSELKEKAASGSQHEAELA
ncbi:hypothetical protein GIB67_016453 [Kingdonia uniflora]|uniref:Uncharacterized protein n=1 Tax=Kingdonia uniflora TaxID=39325 RepID=A0A7J7MH62_9MAGN|nr:hypothetical protein GIB67_016453 [Kingdonia uniflora]